MERLCLLPLPPPPLLRALTGRHWADCCGSWWWASPGPECCLCNWCCCWCFCFRSWSEPLARPSVPDNDVAPAVFHLDGATLLFPATAILIIRFNEPLVFFGKQSIVGPIRLLEDTDGLGEGEGEYEREFEGETWAELAWTRALQPACILTHSRVCVSPSSSISIVFPLSVTWRKAKWQDGGCASDQACQLQLVTLSLSQKSQYGLSNTENELLLLLLLLADLLFHQLVSYSNLYQICLPFFLK